MNIGRWTRGIVIRHPTSRFLGHQTKLTPTHSMNERGLGTITIRFSVYYAEISLNHLKRGGVVPLFLTGTVESRWQETVIWANGRGIHG